MMLSDSVGLVRQCRTRSDEIGFFANLLVLLNKFNREELLLCVSHQLLC